MPSVGVLLIVSVFCLSLAIVNGVSIFPTDQLLITEGAGFLVYLIPDQIGDPLRWIHCSVTVGGASYSLDSDQIHVIEGLTKVQRFSVDACGIRVQNVRKSLDSWKLSALDSESKSFEKILKVEVSTPKQISTLNVTISDTVRSYIVTCPDDNSRRFCRIIDEENRIYDGCSKSFKITSETARFRCRMLYWGGMDETETVINVLVEKSKRDITWSIEENDSHVVMTCQYQTRISPCRAVSSTSQKQIMILDGHMSDHYSSYNTKVSQGICVLEIRKPVLKNDYGVWRIYLPLTENDYTGCVFDLKPQHDEITDQNDMHVPPSPKLIEVFHDPLSASTTTTELSCEASYPIDYCYLSGPHGGNYATDSFDRMKTLGFCKFQVSNITSGIWACGFNDANGGEDRMSYFDVKVYEQPGRAITNQIKASKGDENKRLLCKTILDLPIEICRFVNPTGEVHGLSENIVPADGTRFRYHGKGLRAGECGMEITEVEREDFGWWKCAIKVQGNDYTLGMELIEEVMSQAAIVAISVTVTIIVCTIGGFFAYKKFNRRSLHYQSGIGLSTGGLSQASNRG